MMSTVRGFTLVELILVIVMIGILSAVVGPRFFARQAFDERLFFEESLAAVRYAQKLALASGCQVQVSLDAGGYRLRREKNCVPVGIAPDFCEADPDPSPCQILGPDGQAYAVTQVPAPNGVVLMATNFPVVFDSLGRSSSAATASIGGFVLNVTAETGLVQ